MGVLGRTLAATTKGCFMSATPPPYGDQNRDDSTQSGSPYAYDPQAQPHDQQQGAPQQYSQAGYGQQGYPQRGYQSAPAYGGGQPPSEMDNNLGIIALVTGLVGLFVLPPVAIAGIIYGRRSQAAAEAGRATNGGMGTAGFIMGIIGTILFALYAIATVLVIIAIFGTTVSMN